jgi:hypothetical protein
MAIKLISGILILVTCVLSVSHGWQSLTMSSAEAHAALGLEFLMMPRVMLYLGHPFKK